MSGKLIVIEGLDGSGKATQSKLLLESLRAKGVRCEALSFPCYDEEYSALVRMYLGGRFGDKPGDVNCYAASVFYAVDRYASYKTSWLKGYEEGTVYVADRYTTSNAVYQTSKLPENEWDAFLDWLYDFEYNKLGIPAPDRVIYLDVQPELSETLMAKRYAGDETKKDIHEKDIEYQRRSRAAAKYCAEKQGWHIVECGEGGVMRSIEDISRDLLSAVIGVTE